MDNTTHTKLQYLIARIENLKKRQESCAREIQDVYSEVQAKGFDASRAHKANKASTLLLSLTEDMQLCCADVLEICCADTLKKNAIQAQGSEPPTSRDSGRGCLCISNTGSHKVCHTIHGGTIETNRISCPSGCSG